MKKITSFILALIIVLTFTSCGADKNQIVRTLTVSNDTDIVLTSMIMAPTADDFDTDKAITIFGAETPMTPKSAIDYSVEFPADIYKGNWLIAITGSNIETKTPYSAVMELGEVFNTPADKPSTEVWGFQVGFDSQKNNLFIYLLDDKSI